LWSGQGGAGGAGDLEVFPCGHHQSSDTGVVGGDLLVACVVGGGVDGDAKEGEPFGDPGADGVECSPTPPMKAKAWMPPAAAAIAAMLPARRWISHG
jgi:hypothetical protein